MNIETDRGRIYANKCTISIYSNTTDKAPESFGELFTHVGTVELTTIIHDNGTIDCVSRILCNNFWDFESPEIWTMEE